MLGDAAGFARRHFGAADVVQQRSLAVVHVAHDGHHRRARQRFGLGVLLLVREGLRVVQRGNHGGVAQLFYHDHGGILVQRLVDGDHLAQLHQLLDDFGCLNGHLVRQFSHGNGLGHVHFQHPEFRCRCGAVVFAVAVTTALATGSGAPVGRAAGTGARVTPGFEFFLFGRIAGPAARQLGRFDLFARARCATCTSRFGAFGNRRAGCRFVQRAFDSTLGVHGRLGLFFLGSHGHLVGRGHHHPNGSGLGLGLAAAIAQNGSAFAFFQGRFFGD